MNFFKEIEDVHNNQLKIKKCIDDVLDLYKKNPNGYSKILKKLTILDGQFEEFANEIMDLQHGITR